jgi:hypothetical protein
MACLAAGSPKVAVRVLELLPAARVEILGRIDIVRLAIGLAIRAEVIGCLSLKANFSTVLVRSILGLLPTQTT